MNIKETGKYKLTEDWSSRGSSSIGNYAKGNILEITQIDSTYKKVIGRGFRDWAPWNIPAVKIGEL